MQFKNLPLTVKILSLLFLLALVSVGAAFFAGSSMKTISDGYADAIQGEIRAAKYLSQAEKQIVWVERSILQNIWSLSAENNRKFAGDTLNGRKSFHDNLDHARAALPEQAEAFDKLSREFDDVVGSQCARTFTLANAATSLEGDAKAAAEMNAVCEPKLTELSNNISDFSKKLSLAADTRSKELVNSAGSTVVWTYTLILGGTAAILTVAAIISKLFVVKPLLELTNAMNTISKGNLSVVVSGTDRQDELGSMAQTVDAFRLSLAEAERLREQMAAAEAEKRQAELLLAEKERLKAEKLSSSLNNVLKTVSELDGNIATVASAVEQSTANIQEILSASATVENNVQEVGESANKMSDNMQTVASATEEMTASLNMVVAAVEEMRASLGEVSQNASRASSIANSASQKVDETKTIVENLGVSANEIGKIVELIQNIAAQTNLLAFNATIESASAGEAGKGFAIVANEVKELARQSTEATETIRSQIEAMQKNTHDSINAINSIEAVIKEMNQINHTIAGAVEEQTSTSNEIALNISNTAEAANEVSRNISDSASLANNVAQHVKASQDNFEEITRNLEELGKGSTEIAKASGDTALKSSRIKDGLQKTVSESAGESMGQLLPVPA